MILLEICSDGKLDSGRSRFCGWIFDLRRSPSMETILDKRITTLIAVVVTAAWAVSFILGAVNTNYIPPASISALMMLVAGAAFGQSVFAKRNGDGAGNH